MGWLKYEQLSFQLTEKAWGAELYASLIIYFDCQYSLTCRNINLFCVLNA